MIRRAVWEEVGGFDESFHPLWFDDVDFCRQGIHLPISKDVAHAAEIAALPLLARGGALRFMLTRLVDWLNVPPGAKVGAVKLLESGAIPKSTRDGNRLEVEVPRIRLHEVVAVDLA